MPEKPPAQYGWILVRALAGVAFLGLGLWLAIMSDPDRYPDDVRFDRTIDLYAISGFGCTILGVGLFLTAVRHTTASMTSEQKREINSGAAAGLLLQFAGVVLYGMEFHQPLGGFLLLVGIPVLIWSCSIYARAKGYSGQVGWLGLLGVIGLMILLILPARSDEPTFKSRT